MLCLPTNEVGRVQRPEGLAKSRLVGALEVGIVTHKWLSYRKVFIVVIDFLFMINPSKKQDPRFWRGLPSSAIETIEDARVRQLAKQGDLKIKAIGKHYVGPAAGYSTLSFGERTVNEGPDWEVTEPVLAVLVSGHNYQLGQELPKLPKGYKPLRTVFG